MSQARVLPGVSSAGQFAAVLHAPSPVQLGTPSEEQLRRTTVNAIYTAGRGFGRNRYGNPDRIQEAYDASATYVASLGDPMSPAETEARDAYEELCDQYQADKDGLDDKERRTRQFGAARQVSWIIEYRDQAKNKAMRNAREGA